MAGNDIWQTIVLKELRRTVSKYKQNTTMLIQVVQKVKNGKHVAIKVRVGEEYVKAATGELAFKATDMSLADLKMIVPHLPELEILTKSPPAVPEPEPAAEGKKDVGF